MDKYSDLDFFLNKNYKTNDISLKKEIDALSQSVKNIILTDPGERMFDPYFGAGIPETIFEPLIVRPVPLPENVPEAVPATDILPKILTVLSK